MTLVDRDTVQKEIMMQRLSGRSMVANTTRTLNLGAGDIEITGLLADITRDSYSGLFIFDFYSRFLSYNCSRIFEQCAAIRRREAFHRDWGFWFDVHVFSYKVADLIHRVVLDVNLAHLPVDTGHNGELWINSFVDECLIKDIQHCEYEFYTVKERFWIDVAFDGCHTMGEFIHLVESQFQIETVEEFTDRLEEWKRATIE